MKKNRKTVWELCSRSLLLMAGFVCSCAALAQSVLLNDSWEFQRLRTSVPVGEVRNQGSDWNSQFNVEHVAKNNFTWLLPDKVVEEESGQLAAGSWEQVRLPHTPFVEPLVVQHQWQGICYYRRKLHLDALPAGRQWWLEMEGAMQLADLWINGRHVAQHAGGYTPFVVDATPWLRAGDNELLVRLDNRDNALIPPGKPLNRLDFCYYGGLYRDVRLIVKPDLYITHPILANRVAGGGIFVTYPQVSRERAEVLVRTGVGNRSAAEQQVEVRHTLYEWSRKGGRGRKVAVALQRYVLLPRAQQEQEQRLLVERPRLWSPDSPQLYSLLTEVVADGRTVDSEETRIGIRRIEMSREKGCLINGQPLRLVGCNRHMEYPYVGNALSDAAQFRDMWQIRQNGFNVVRLGHYPQDVSVLEACDELGLLVIEPIPGWQFFNRAPLFTELTYRDVRHLIRRDRNHPCVLMWETTLNESWPPDAWKDGAVSVAHEEYPGDQCFTSGDAYGYDGFDVCYNDWQEGFHRPNRTRKPGFIREYYDYEFGGHYSTTRIGIRQGERALRQNLWNAQWSHNRYRADYPHTMGDAVWSMYDYNRGGSDNICESGMADLFRRPKFSLPFFRTQMAAGSWKPAGAMPYELFIASWWTAASPDTVQVLGNVDEVELRLNGRPVGRKRADSGPSTDYVPSADGGNCEHLAFPPFTFMQVPREPGELEAVGYVGGKAVARYRVRTPEEPAALAVDYFESGRPAEINDLLLVHVRLVDGRGTTVPENGREVRLQVKGGTVVGPSAVATEAGIASFLVRTAQQRRLKVEAVCGNFTKGRSWVLKK